MSFLLLPSTVPLAALMALQRQRLHFPDRGAGSQPCAAETDQGNWVSPRGFTTCHHACNGTAGDGAVKEAKGAWAVLKEKHWHVLQKWKLGEELGGIQESGFSIRCYLMPLVPNTSNMRIPSLSFGAAKEPGSTCCCKDQADSQSGKHSAFTLCAAAVGLLSIEREVLRTAPLPQPPSTEGEEQLAQHQQVHFEAERRNDVICAAKGPRFHRLLPGCGQEPQQQQARKARCQLRTSQALLPQALMCGTSGHVSHRRQRDAAHSSSQHSGSCREGPYAVGPSRCFNAACQASCCTAASPWPL